MVISTSVIRRDPRERVNRAKAHLTRTTRRFWKPIRYQVDAPGDPGEWAAQSDEMEVGDGAGTADRGEVALVAVPECRSRATGETVGDQASRIAALLDCDRRDTREGVDVTGRVADADHVAGDDHLRVAG